MAEKQKQVVASFGAQSVGARQTGNSVVDREDNQREKNGVRMDADGFETMRNIFGNAFTPPAEAPKVSALEPNVALNPSLVPASPAPGLGGLDAYKSSMAHIDPHEITLFFPQPPNNVQFPRALDSQNLMALPPRFSMSKIYQIFSKPRKGSPGYNPGGVNTTPTP